MVKALKFVWYTLAGIVSALLVAGVVSSVIYGVFRAFVTHWIVGVISLVGLVGGGIGMGVFFDKESRNNRRY